MPDTFSLSKLIFADSLGAFSALSGKPNCSSLSLGAISYRGQWPAVQTAILNNAKKDINVSLDKVQRCTPN